MRRLVVRFYYVGKLLDIKPDAECFFAGVDVTSTRARIRIISRTKRGRIIDAWRGFDDVDGFHCYWMEQGHKLYLELRIFDLQKLPREKAARAVPWLKEQREQALENRKTESWRERVS